MVENHYRWDFIGLSTDEKPTPETSEKVVDGSTFYCSDNSKLYVYCKDNWYERKALGGGGGGTSYTAGTGIDITDDTISVDTETIQEKLTAGSNITISDNVISASGGGGDSVYSSKTTSSSASGGAVYIGSLNSSQEENPDPTVTDNHYSYFWALPADSSVVPASSTINILGNISGSSTGDIVIGQNALASGDTAGGTIAIGTGSLAYNDSVVIGNNGTMTNSSASECVAIGHSAKVKGNLKGAVALGMGSEATRTGEVNVGAKSSTYGFNSTNYRVIGGVHDGQLANDAVTVGQVNSVIDAINTALSTNIPHIGASS